MDRTAKELEENVAQVLGKYQHDRGMLVSVLQDIQAALNYLPEEALEQVSQSLELPVSQVYSVATFFRSFSLTPRGRPG